MFDGCRVHVDTAETVVVDTAESVVCNIIHILYHLPFNASTPGPLARVCLSWKPDHEIIIPPVYKVYRGYIVIPPANCVCGWVYCFHVVRPSIRYILYSKYLKEAMMEFHQTLHTHSYLQGKYL